MVAILGKLSDDDAKVMSASIQEGCERIDPREW